MRNKIALFLCTCLLAAGTSIAQQKKPAAKPKPRTTTKSKTAKPAVTSPAVAKIPACYPLKEVKDYYKIDIKDPKFKDDFEEIFELSPYDYSGYSLKTIIENTIRMRLGDAAANNLDLFAGATYLEISFMKGESKKLILEEICTLFADHNAFEKHINTLKKASRENTSNWRK